MNRQGVLYTVIFTFLIAFAFVFLLALANEGTREQVAYNRAISRQRAILTAMGLSAATDAEVEELFAGVETIERNGIQLYATEIDGETVYAKEFAGSGLWGTIEGVIAVEAGLGRAVGIEIIAHNETPGLGGRIDEPEFKAQFRGEAIVDGRIEVGSAGPGDQDYDNGKIDAITGASRTSDSMRTIINAELEAFSDAIGGQA